MSGQSNFPTAIDDDSSLHSVTDNVSTIQASDHNNLKEAAIALQRKVGVYNSNAPTSLDYLLGHPTGGHNHNGASGMGGPVGVAAPAVLYAEINSPATTPTTAGSEVPLFWDTFYDVNQASFGQPPVEGKLGYASGYFTASQNGLYLLEFGLDIHPSPGASGGIRVTANDYGDQPHVYLSPTSNQTPVIVHKNLPMIAGDQFSLQQIASGSSKHLLDYVSLQIIRLSDI